MFECEYRSYCNRDCETCKIAKEQKAIADFNNAVENFKTVAKETVASIEQAKFKFVNKLNAVFGIHSPSMKFAKIGFAFVYGFKAGEQAARLAELHRKLFEPYRLPRLVYAPEYKPVASVVFAFRQAQAFYEDY